MIPAPEIERMEQRHTELAIGMRYGAWAEALR